MKKNVSRYDRALRLVLSAGVFVLVYLHVLPGNWNSTTWVVGGILLLTAVFGRCPLYSVCGIDTRAHRGAASPGAANPKAS